MTKHPTLAEVAKKIIAERKLSMVKAAAVIGTTPGTLKKFLAGEVVQDGIMLKVRAFTESPATSEITKSTKAKTSSKSGGQMSLQDLEFMLEIDRDDLVFVVGVMRATGQSSLSRTQMSELAALRK